MEDFMNKLNLTKDEDLLDFYFQTYGDDEAMPARDYLKFWHEAKSEYLLPIFKNQLIYKKEISFDVDIEILISRIHRLFIKDNKNSNIYYKLKNRLFEIVDNLFPNVSKDIRINKDVSCDSYLWVSSCLNFRTLALNRTATTFQYNNFKIPQGTKVFKALKSFVNFALKNKLIEQIEYDEINDFIEYLRIQHSQVFNQKKISGNLCISIHPMDYITMSDNGNNWESCMRWGDGGGDYKVGTLEMLNSPSVVVCYLESKKPWDINDDYSWNNKKWRELFIVDKDFICGVKGYPYPSVYLETMCANWLADLVEEYYHNKFDRTNFRYDKKITFETILMYNDINANGECFLYYSEDAIEADEEIEFNYSGYARCLRCGEIISEDWTDSDTLSSMFLCPNCAGLIFCADCGDLINPEDYGVEHNGNWYCEECMLDHGFFCGECDEFHWNDEDENTAIYIAYKDKNSEQVESKILNYLCPDCINENLEYGNIVEVEYENQKYYIATVDFITSEYVSQVSHYGNEDGHKIISTFAFYHDLTFNETILYNPEYFINKEYLNEEND